MQRFLPFLPSDGDDQEGAEALHAIAEDLEALLGAPQPQFWQVVASDSSLRVLLDTYLRHAPRPFDEGYAARMPLEVAVSQLVLDLLHRM
jgi:activating signal cointegrator complex subunit 2